MKPMSLAEVAARFSDEASAWEYLERLRWNGKPACPRCGSLDVTFLPPRTEQRKTRTGQTTHRRLWRCRDCKRQFSVLIGTIFEGSKIPVGKWLMAIYLMSSAKNGVSALELQRDLGITYKSAWFLVHRIREAMANIGSGRMTGLVVADETFVGGDPKNRHAYDKRPRKANATDKVPVLSVLNTTTGEVRSEVVPNVRKATVTAVLDSHVDRHNTILHTDAGAHYKAVGGRFVAHHTVDHSAGEYVRGDVTTNPIEAYFSQFKRSLDGTFHNVSREHLGRYANEFDFRATTRKHSDGERGSAMIARSEGVRISYEALIASGPVAMGTRPRPVGRPGRR